MWKVKTLLKPGKLQELAKKLAKAQILAIEEARWPNKGQINKQIYLLYSNGTKEKTGQEGTRFLLMKKIQKYIINFQLQNERLCKIRLKRNTTI